MDYPSMNRLAELQQLIADFAKVERMPELANNKKRENDVEHSFGLALTCWYLLPKIAPQLSLEKVLQYALAHDLVELHAGDTFVFDQVNAASKNQREAEAITELEKDWPDFPDLAKFAKGYMNKQDEEARFVKAVDKLLPVIMIELNDDPTIFWNKHKITLAMEQENKVSIHVSDAMSPYYDALIDWLKSRGHMYEESASHR